MRRLRAVVVVLGMVGSALVGAGPVLAVTRQLATPKDLAATTVAMTSAVVSFSPVPRASSYSLFLYSDTGRLSREIVDAVPAGTSIEALTLCTACRISVQAKSDSSSIRSSAKSGKVSFSTRCNSALVPTFATPSSTSDGFTVQITNYDAAYTWSGAITAGTVSLDASGLATVSGLTSDASQTLTVTTTRATYDSGSASVSGSRNVTPASRWLGAGDFTVELWVKPTVDWAGRQELFALTPTDLQGRLDIVYSEFGRWEVLAHNWSSGSPPVSAAMAPPTLGTWTHVALTRHSGTMRLYVAGQMVAESTATADFAGLNVLILGADVNASWCHCNLARARLSNIRVIDGTALYSGITLTVPGSPLTGVAGTTFLLNSALSDPSTGSVELDGTLRYQQGITITEGVPTVSSLVGYRWNGAAWQSAAIVTSTDSPFSP